MVVVEMVGLALHVIFANSSRPCVVGQVALMMLAALIVHLVLSKQYSSINSVAASRLHTLKYGLVSSVSHASDVELMPTAVMAEIFSVLSPEVSHERDSVVASLSQSNEVHDIFALSGRVNRVTWAIFLSNRFGASLPKMTRLNLEFHSMMIHTAPTSIGPSS